MVEIFSPWPKYSDEEISAAERVLRSGKVNYWTGNEGHLFEEEFASWVECKNAIAVSNGTVAIELALRAVGIREGDEVIVTSRTFIASVSTIVALGGVPVFVDLNENSQNIAPENIKAAITSRTKAIICVHLAGWPCEMSSIMGIAKDYGLRVVEDCAQAHGAKYKGKSVGVFGDVGCWSFCQDKIMSTGGEGGMVTTNSDELWSKMWSYKDHGKSYSKISQSTQQTGFRWLHDSFGSNFRMTEMQAAIGRIQLRKMKVWTQRRNAIQLSIWNCARELPALRVPNFGCDGCQIDLCDNCVHAAYKCYVFLELDQLNDSWTRDRVIDELNARGAPCFSGSCSEVYLETAFNGASYTPKTRLPVAKSLGETSLMFPVHPTIKDSEVAMMTDALRDVMQIAAG